MNHIFLLLFFFCSLGSDVYAQKAIKSKELLKKTENSLKSISTLIYKIKQESKSFSENDTIKKSAICSLYVVPTNKMGAYYKIDVSQPLNDLYAHYEYDGVHSTEFLYQNDSLDFNRNVYITNISQNGYNNIGGIGYSLILKDFFKKENIFKQYRSILSKFLIKDITTEDSVYNGTPVYILKVYGKDKPHENRINSSIDTYYIRKSDFLPIAHHFYGEFHGMKQTAFTEIEYLQINPKISIESFKVNPSIKEVKPKVYFDEIKKYKL